MRQEEDLAAGNIFPRVVPPRVMYDSVGINIGAVRFPRVQKTTSRRANISGLTHTIRDGERRCVYAFAILRWCAPLCDPYAGNFPAAFNIWWPATFSANICEMSTKACCFKITLPCTLNCPRPMSAKGARKFALSSRILLGNCKIRAEYTPWQADLLFIVARSLVAATAVR